MTPISSNSPTPPSIPFKVANAYGTKPISVRPVASDPRLGQVSPAGAPKGGISRGTDELIAGAVRTQVDFMANTPINGTAKLQSRDGNSPLAFYRHPADTNAAATSIDLGRSLDVEG